MSNFEHFILTGILLAIFGLSVAVLVMAHGYASFMFNEGRRAAGKPPLKLKAGVLPAGVYKQSTTPKGQPKLVPQKKVDSEIIWKNDESFLRDVYGSSKSPTDRPQSPRPVK